MSVKSAVWSRALLESFIAALGLYLGILLAGLMSGVPENCSMERPNRLV